jgi:Putative prokaryotic signal transducing protein
MPDPVDPWDGDELRQRARKVDPRYSEGPLVKVARARHQAEAEMMENLLLEQGIPALAKRSGGFDVPDFLAAGPRDILVAASGADAARELLHAPASEAPRRRAPAPVWVRGLALLLVVVLVGLVAAGVVKALLL